MVSYKIGRGFKKYLYNLIANHNFQDMQPLKVELPEDMHVKTFNYLRSVLHNDGYIVEIETCNEYVFWNIFLKTSD